jgi:predicted nucleic acid binding AN1-type Zn finger protein
VKKMEERQKEISKNEAKNITLIGKCGKCGKSFEAEAELPIIHFWDLEGNAYRGLASPHLVTLCPYCYGLLNLAMRIETKRG